MAPYRRLEMPFLIAFLIAFLSFFFSLSIFALAPKAQSPVSYSNSPNSLTNSSNRYSDQSIWPVIIHGFALNHHLDNPRVQYFIHYDQTHIALIQAVLNNSQDVLYPITQAIKIRHLPMELALLPAVESGYRLNIESSSGAVGLWQLLPQTAQDYGVLVDSYWYDGREDFLVSTIAALNFLSDLNNQLDHHWLLAIAAYNSGETTIKNAINQNKAHHLPTDFFDLSLPNQTQDYVPKLLALSEIIQNPKKYGFVLPNIPNKPQVSQVYLTHQIDLSTAASFSHISLNTINKLNPDLTHGILPNQGPSYLYLPIENAEHFKVEAAQHNYDQIWDLYEVEPGEFLSTIARNHQISISDLEKINDLSSMDLQPHQTLITPLITKPNTNNNFNSSIRKSDVLKPNQTLSDFSKAHHLDFKNLVLINGLDPANPPEPGSRLLIS